MLDRATKQELRDLNDARRKRIAELEAERSDIMQRWAIESDESLTECVERNIDGWRTRCEKAEAEVARLRELMPGYRNGMHQALIRAADDLDWGDALYALNKAAEQMEDVEARHQVVKMPDGSRISVNLDAEPRKTPNVYEIRAALGDG
jgi:hypothetical protein